MGQTGGFAVQILLHINNATLRVCQWSTSSHHRVKARHKQPACSDRASETRPILSLIKLSVISGIDPKAGQFLVPCLSCRSRWVCCYPAVLRLLHSGKSLFPSGLCLPAHVPHERSSSAPVVPPRGSEAAGWDGCSAPGSQPQLSLLRVGAAAPSSLALLTAAGLRASIVCSP